MTPSPHAIEAHGLVKRYGDKTALAGIDLEVPTGTVTAVLGPNGAGKTTAVRILTTLSDADEGEATVAGFDVATQANEVRRRIGLAAQDATVDPLLTGRENLVMLGELHQLGAARRPRPGPSQLLEEFSPDRRRRPGHLRLLGRHAPPPRPGRHPRGPTPRCCSSTSPPPASTPGPATSCGPCSTHLVDRGTTVLLTTQYLEEAERLADDIIVIDHGRIIARGDARKLKRAGRRRPPPASSSSTPTRLDEAARLVAEVTGAEPLVDADARSVTAPISQRRRRAGRRGQARWPTPASRSTT